MHATQPARCALLVLCLPLLLVWLSGCASSAPPAQRYALPTSPAAATPPPDSPTHVIQVTLPRVADYLDVEGIVLQLDDITLNEARQHVWAEPLPQQLRRTLHARLATNLPDTRLLRSDDAPSADALTLHLDVDRFQGFHDGTARAEGQWQLRDPSGQALIVEDFSASTELADDGYPALVRALGKSWSQVADRIGRTIRDRL
ncbi:PqiC family protein [Billgrantia gudaonensis]|uniref:ABC-type transport auxiliary lipoprotein component domain-containing protein n=1 Tax=Billgrantia gudaonensis TaxID=376427 RepID=A0A1G8X0H5_9GAMM|nr:ABC-type transport auxiliary lipoprotein family protein [Halomonas gudaonensis]SDJ83961.1 hypothetical protein SAMN04487954_108156 [Halomonas gudaonensis]